MRKLFTLMIIALSFQCFSQTQAKMNKEAYADFDKTDKQLNEIYQTILSSYKTDTLFMANLKKAQRIWIQFRDAEMEMKYPAYPGNFYGTIQPTCRALYLQKLTESRIETLKKWLGGMEEGDVCKGSVKTINNIDSENLEKAYIKKDGAIWLSANMKKDHRIFGYKQKSIDSEKMILLSIFTNEVKYNPFNCKYGAFYDTNGMKDLSLKYLATENDFLKVAIIKEEKTIDEVYMQKKYFEFEKL